MTTDTLADVTAIHVLRNLHEGDVVWITVREDMAQDELEAVQQVICSVIDEEVSLIITRKNYVENIQQRTLQDLLTLREVLDSAIDTYAITHAHDVEG